MKSHWVDGVLGGLSRDRPVLIAGPTASGKSALALALAIRDDRLIVNADALQVYARWRILTARPGDDELALADHRLYGHIGRDQMYSTGHWLRDVEKVLKTGRRVVIVGGTGLNFRALTRGLADIPAIAPEVRQQADARRAAEGLAGMLADLDPATRARIDPANGARVQRAWEVMQTTGRALADWQDDTGQPMLALPDVEAVALHPNVDWLNQRIDQRFDAMMAEGALAEVAAELPYWQAKHPSARAIGAAELIVHLRGELPLAAAVAAAKLASRHYAKRQRTWIRTQMAAWPGLSLP